MTVHLTARDEAKIGLGNLARVASEIIAADVYPDIRDYSERRADLLHRAVMLAADIEELAGERPADVERLQVQSARADGYQLRRRFEAIRGIEWRLKAL